MSFDRSYELASREQLIGMSTAALRRLMEVIEPASEADCLEKFDDAGWNSRDHLAHVSSYQWSAIFPLQGRTRAEAFGVTEAEVLLGFDELNELIRARTRHQPLSVVIGEAVEAHDALVEQLRTIEMDALRRPNSDVAPDLLRFLSDIPYVHAYMYCSVTHYDQHREYIERILAS